MARSRKKVSKVARPEKQGIPVDADGAPIEGTEAGDAGDVGTERMLANVRRARASANRHVQSAQRLIGQAPAAAEREARLAIEAIVTAFWWAEDSDQEEAQHILMHKIGRWTRQRFGCSVTFEDGRYLRRCSNRHCAQALRVLGWLHRHLVVFNLRRGHIRMSAPS